MTVLCLVERAATARPRRRRLGPLTFARSPPGPGAGRVAAAVFGPGAVPAEVLSTYGVADAYAVCRRGTGTRRRPGPVPWPGWRRAARRGRGRGGHRPGQRGAGPPGARSPACRWPPTASPPPPTGPARWRSSSGTAGRAACWRTRVLEAPRRAAHRRRPTRCRLAGRAPAARPPCTPSRPRLADADLAVRATESAERSAGVSLATARVVVGGGAAWAARRLRGIEELAGLLGGALGVSRVVTSEGWRPHQQQVGRPGTRISPSCTWPAGSAARSSTWRAA